MKMYFTSVQNSLQECWVSPSSTSTIYSILHTPSPWTDTQKLWNLGALSIGVNNSYTLVDTEQMSVLRPTLEWMSIGVQPPMVYKELLHKKQSLKKYINIRQMIFRGTEIKIQFSWLLIQFFLLPSCI